MEHPDDDLRAFGLHRLDEHLCIREPCHDLVVPAEQLVRRRHVEEKATDLGLVEHLGRAYLNGQRIG